MLLDTHAVLWLANDPKKLSAPVLDRVASGERLFVSVASAWEYGIKRASRPGTLQYPFEQLIENGDIDRLDFGFALHRFAETLPPIHGDPFDRMLIAQAIDLGLVLVTRDEAIKRYDVETLW